ncbi:MAG: hypothetical protein IJR97_08920 [Clostridia bacterium]|nr:hypothetical protein [Clostridia bacterium]
MYCPNCHRLFEEDVCPECGALGRHPKDDDYCLMSRREAIWAGMLADVLKQEGIDHIQESEEGAAMRTLIGTGLGYTLTYVPYSDLERADALEEALFNAEAIVTDEAESGEEGSRSDPGDMEERDDVDPGPVSDPEE